MDKISWRRKQLTREFQINRNCKRFVDSAQSEVQRVMAAAMGDKPGMTRAAWLAEMRAHNDAARKAWREVDELYAKGYRNAGPTFGVGAAIYRAEIAEAAACRALGFARRLPV